MTVYKFGGTSLGDADRYRHAAELVRASAGSTVVVVSAPAGVTDQLVRLAQEAEAGRSEAASRLLGEIRGRCEAIGRDLDPERDALLEGLAGVLSGLEGSVAGMAREGVAGPHFSDAISAVGEDVSVQLMGAALTGVGLDPELVDSRDVVRTDDRFGAAIPRDEETAALVRDRLQPLLEAGRVPVLQGFVGATAEGVTTTLGRGGSDFTAAIVGAALDAGEVCIWTDVDGVMSADPAQVAEAHPIPELGYEEAVELAYFGARAVHPAAAKHAAAREVKLRVKNSFRPEVPGTLIRPDTRRASGVAAVAYKPDVTLLKVRSRPMFMAYGFLALVFEVLARHKLPVDLVATSHTSTAFTIDAGEGLDEVARELGRFAEVEAVSDLATVSVIGHGLLARPGIVARVFAALGRRSVELISQASDVSLSFLVGADSAPEVVRRLHAELIESGGDG